MVDKDNEETLIAMRILPCCCSADMNDRVSHHQCISKNKNAICYQNLKLKRRGIQIEAEDLNNEND